MIAWDWKYRIFFDKEIRRELDQKKSALTVSELEIFNDELRFYLSFYSFGILFDLIAENPLKVEEYTETALNNRDKIIKHQACWFDITLKNSMDSMSPRC